MSSVGAAAHDGSVVPSNEMTIEAWHGVLFDRFLSFRDIVTTGLCAHSEQALRLHPPRPGDRALDIVAKTICSVRGYCGRRGGFQVFVTPWIVYGKVPGNTSSAGLLDRHVEISEGDIMFAVGRPELPANDVIAHKLGHVMDLEYARDRFAGDGSNQQGREVMEALADMFAYDFDRAYATAFELSVTGVARDWANPAAEQYGATPTPPTWTTTTPPRSRTTRPRTSTRPSSATPTTCSCSASVTTAPNGSCTTCRRSSARGRPSRRSRRRSTRRAFTIHDSATAGHVTSAFGEVGLNSIAPQLAGVPVARRCQRPGEEPVPGTLPASVQLATIADSTPSRMSSSQVTVLGAGARVST
jgi:hypothetical protein